jgi:hypothetical protein
MVQAPVPVQAPPTGWQREVTLPVGVAQTGNGSLLRQATLRKMTGREEALLADPMLRSNGGKLITALLTNCVKAIGGQPVNEALIRQLTSADRNYLLLELRRLTFGDEMTARYPCPHCGGINLVNENLAELPIRALEDGFHADIRVPLDDGYGDPDGQWHRDVVFRLPTGEDEEAVGNRRDDNPVRQRDALQARCLKAVGNLEEKRIRALGPSLLAALSITDRRRIQAAIDEATPGLELTRTMACIHCGHEFQSPLDMSNFFPLA